MPFSLSKRFNEMTAKEKEKCRDRPLRKLIQFYIGKKVDQCETGRLCQSSLDTICYELFSIDEVLQAKLTLNIRPSEFVNNREFLSTGSALAVDHL